MAKKWSGMSYEDRTLAEVVGIHEVRTEVDVVVDLPFQLVDGKVHFRLPAIQIPAYDGPVLSEDVRQWSMDAGISEEVYGRAYTKARDAMNEAIRVGMVMEVLQDHMTVE